MANYFLTDEHNFKWKIGDDSSGFFNLPLYESCKIKILTLINTSTSIAAGQTTDLELDSGVVTSNIGTFYPYLISGYDLTGDVGIYIQKMYVEAGSKLIKVRLANMASSSKNVSRLNIRVVYHLRYNNFLTSS